MTELLNLQEHCFLLSCLVSELDTKLRPERSKSGHFSSWLSASDWLLIAAGVEKVEINTSRFDESVMYCGGAWEYEAKRSELLTQMGTRLTSFNFIWGGFETVIKLINPPYVPRNIKKRRTVIDDAVFYLKNKYEPTPPISQYDETVAQLRLLLRVHPNYHGLEKEFRIHSFIGISGLGAHIVRIIRNDFAHGSATLPKPNEWSSKNLIDSELSHLEVIEVSSRILLLTIQMLLLAHLKGRQLTVSCLRDEYGRGCEENVHIALRILHLDNPHPNEDQHPLFERPYEHRK